MNSLSSIFFIILLVPAAITYSSYVTNSTGWERCAEIIQHLPKHPTNEQLELSVISSGLYPFLEEHMYEYPMYLRPYCGRGVGMWQYPNQFAKYLNNIRHFPISHYVEIGTGAGGTFIFTTEFLKTYNPSLFSVGVDIQEIGRPYAYREEVSPYDGNFLSYILSHPNTGFLQGEAINYLTRFPDSIIDLLLIDGDHSYAGIKRDFELLLHRSKLLVFHDIVSIYCPGVVQFWNELKSNYSHHIIEYIDQYPMYYNVSQERFLGIGVLVNPLYFQCDTHRVNNNEQDNSGDGDVSVACRAIL